MTESRAREPAVEVRSEPSSPRFISLERGSIAYFEQGDPSGPLVILQHGFPDYPKTFFPLMELLCAKGYRCVAPFLRGYVPSTTLGPFHQGRLADDLADVARALSPDRPAVVIGHDWGAVATYGAVHRWPNLFRRAVTLAVPHTGAFQRNMQKNAAQRRRSAYMAFFMVPFVPERIVPLRDFAFVDKLWRRWSPGYVPASEYMLELKSCLGASMPAPLSHYRALRPTSIRPKAAGNGERARIEVPLLHLHGRDDGCIAFEAGEGQERYFRAGFRSENLPGLGHFLQLEDPGTIAGKIANFLDAPS